MAEDEFDNSKKAHIKRKSGKKFDKKKKQDDGTHKQELTARQRNPKAFAIQNTTKTERRVRRKEDLGEKRKHVPLVDRTPLEPPPVVVAIVGPPKVGKTTLLQGLVKNFTRQTLTDIRGPVTVVSGKKRRLTLIECPNDINSMIDIAKIADLVLLLVDASFGFEMEIFEFLNICQVHGFPRIMGVLTHLDSFKNSKTLQRTKKNLKQRFWTEVYQGAKLFYLSGVVHGKEYQKTEVHNLGRFISVMKFRPLVWRTSHPHVLADRIEDVTDPEDIRRNRKCDRHVSLYGYLRGTILKRNQHLHVAGVGDFPIDDVAFLPDPCPLPDGIKKRSLVEKDKSIYAPMSGVGGIVYDKDAVYIDLGGSHSHRKADENRQQQQEEEEGEEEIAGRGLVENIIATETTLNEKLEKSEMRLFTGSAPVISGQHLETEEGEERRRRKAVFGDEEEDIGESSDEDDNDSEEASDEEGDDEDNNKEDENVEDEEGEEEEDEEHEKESEDEDEKTCKIVSTTQKSVKRSVEITQQQPTKKMKICSINEQIMKEIGDDSSEASDSEEEKEHSVVETVRIEDNLEIRDDVKTAKDLFHPRLTTETDRSVHNKLSEALEKISQREAAVKEESSDEEQLDDEEESDDDEDQSEEENDMDEEKEDQNETKDNKEDAEDATIALNWKADLAMKARDSYYARQSGTASLRRLVYGQEATAVTEEEEEEEETVGGLFKLKTDPGGGGGPMKKEAHGLDCSVWRVTEPQDWSLEVVRDRIKDCFVTGAWAKGRDAEELMKLDDEDDEEMFGDFEDLETGETVSGKVNEEEEEDKPNVVDYGSEREKELAKRKERMERKLKLKRQFDTEYDDGEGEKSSYYDDLKKEVDDQANLNRSEFEGMEDSLRVQYEGFRPGMYVRLEVSGVPCELMDHHQPSFPLVLGGLLKGEDQLGYVQVRIKKHRWYPRILKNKDPLIISLGWRRFQSLPIYSICDHNMRHRMLKYTPEHLHCDAHFWGPITPQGTGMLAVQSVADKQENFKIVATGVVLELDKSTQIVKKLKLTGEPYKIFKKTAFIKGMFNSSLEVAKFEKAAIRTVSGIRGMIKKNLASPEGAFRATFEDKILMSDIVFVKTWYQVEVPKYYAVVTNLLKEAAERSNWKGMRTVAEIKREANIQNSVNEDSLYKAVTRTPKVFNPLQIPKKLQAELPYNLKPKVVKKGFDPAKDRVAVVLDHKERKVQNAFNMLREMYGQKQESLDAEKKKRVAEFIKKKDAVEEKKMKRQKEARKQISRMVSKSKAKEERMAMRKGGKRSKND